jgi:hypothetical protein
MLSVYLPHICTCREAAETGNWNCADTGNGGRGSRCVTAKKTKISAPFFVRVSELSQLATRTGDDKFEHEQFSTHFVKASLKIPLHIFTDKLGNVRIV